MRRLGVVQSPPWVRRRGGGTTWRSRPGSSRRARSDPTRRWWGGRTGDQVAFGELYRRHGGAARAFAHCLVGRGADADDAVAEAFTNILAALQHGGGPEVAFRPYLMVCVRNACYRAGRRRPNERSIEDDDVDVATGDDPLVAVVESSVLAKAFFSLPARWQHVLWRTEVEGHRPSELVAECGISAGAIAALSFRAREGLADAYLQASLPQGPLPPACRDVVSLLPGYVRDKLGVAATGRVERHLERCESCEALQAELRQARRPLRSALGPAVLGVAAAAYAPSAARGVFRVARALLGTKFLATATVTALAVGVVGSGAPPWAVAEDARTPTGTVAATPSDPAGGASAGRRAGAPAGAGGAGGSAGVAATAAAGAVAGADPAGAPGLAAGAGAAGATAPAVTTTPGTDAAAGTDTGLTGVVPAITVPPISAAPVTLPVISVPPVSLPPVTLPVISVPPVTLPVISVPPVTVPLVPLPPVTVPVISVPPVTVPVISVPPVTVPPVTVPVISVPPVTVPVITIPPLPLPVPTTSH